MGYEVGWQGRSVQFKLYFFYCSIVSVRVSVINTGSSIQVCILCSGQILRLAKILSDKHKLAKYQVTFLTRSNVLWYTCGTKYQAKYCGIYIL